MNKRSTLLATAAMVIGWGIAFPVLADPPPWAPAHGYRAKEVREYRYVYYPVQQVYYAPQTQTWFWLNGGNWQVGVNLPGPLQINVGSGGIPVVLHSDRPYVEHVYVEERYGRPWREAHDERERHRHGHENHRHGDHD